MKKYFLLLLFCITTSMPARSQGCNDAGFCTIGDMKPAADEDSATFTTGLGSSFRLGEKETAWLTLQVQGELPYARSGNIAFQIPFHLMTGALGFFAGPGDPAISVNQNLLTKDSLRMSFTVAGKIPVNEANLKKDNEVLPMAYQPSQGTWDGIAGVNLFMNQWHFSIAYQHNFNANGNRYIDSLKTSEPDIHFYDSQKIDRGDDVLLRIERIFKGKGKTDYFVSVLPIYRIEEATVVDADGERISVDGSSGLTININAGLVAPLGKKGSMKLLAGAPAITRHVRPDGLTGTFVVSFSVSRVF